jgi:hypothetical protein
MESSAGDWFWGEISQTIKIILVTPRQQSNSKIHA